MKIPKRIILGGGYFTVILGYRQIPNPGTSVIELLSRRDACIKLTL